MKHAQERQREKEREKEREREREEEEEEILPFDILLVPKLKYIYLKIQLLVRVFQLIKRTI